MPVTLLTSQALALIAAAAGGPPAVAITHIALGDAPAYAPSPAQTALVSERLRLPVTSQTQITLTSWIARATLPENAIAFPCRELGFFDSAGRLIAVWGGLDVVPRQTGIMAWQIEHVLSFAASPAGSIIVEAPSDALYNFMLSTLADQALQHRALLARNIYPTGAAA
jgi:hypothetical protein